MLSILSSQHSRTVILKLVYCMNALRKENKWMCWVNSPICPTNSMRIPWCSSLLPVCFTLIFTLGWHNTMSVSCLWNEKTLGNDSHRRCLLAHLSWNWFSIIKQIMLLQFPIFSLQLGCFSAFSIVQNDIDFTHWTKQTSKETLKERQCNSVFFNSPCSPCLND